MATSAATLFPTGTSFLTIPWYLAQLSFRAGRRAYATIQRATTVYIKQDAAGDSSGGSGTGDYATPYLCNTASDLATFVASIDQADLLIVLYDSSVFRGTTGTLVLAFAQMSLGRTNHADAPPCLTGYLADSAWGGAWAQDGSSRWNRDLGTAINWTHDTLDPLTIETGENRVWSRTTSLAEFDAHSVATYGPCFFVSVTTVYVKYNAGNTTPSGLVEFISRTTSLVQVNDVDACRLDGLCIHGGRMDGTNANWPLDIKCEGTNACVVSDCTISHGSTHLAEPHTAASGTHSGGYAYFYQCEFSGMRVDGSGVCNAVSAYAYDGGHECIIDSCRLLHGALPDYGRAGWNATRRKAGTLWYAHDGDGTHSLELFMAFNNTMMDHQYGGVTFGLNGAALPYDDTTYTRTRLLTHGRSFQWGNTHEGGANTRNDLSHNYEVIAWERSNNAVAPTDWTLGVDYIMESPATRKHAIYIGCSFGNDFDGIAATFTALRHIAESNNCYIDFVYHGDFNLNVATNTMAFDAGSADVGKYRGIRRFNCIWSTNQANSAGGIGWAKNGQPTLLASGADSTVVGGAVSSAFFKGGTIAPATIYKPDFGVPPAVGSYDGYDTTTGFIDLTLAAVAGAVPAAGSQLFQTASALTHDYSALAWWIDASGTARFMPAAPSVGPEQQAGMVPITVGGNASSSATKLLLLD